MKNFNLSLWAINRPVLSAFFIVTIIALGIVAFLNLGQRDMPSRTDRVMVVSVQWPGATAAEMEQQITDKIERKLQETPWLYSLLSFSKPGESFILINLEDGTPNASTTVPATWYQVRKKIGDMRHELPPGIRGPFFNDEFGDVFPLVYALSAPELPFAELKDYADQLRNDVLRLNMVEKANLLGVQPEQIEIALSRSKVASFGLSPMAIMTQIQQANSIEPQGFIEDEQSRYFIRANQGFESVEAIGELLINSVDGKTIRLKDVATITRGYLDPPRVKMRFDGESVIGLALSMRAGGNVVDMGKQVSEHMIEVRKKLPEGISLRLVNNQPEVVTGTLNLFQFKLMFAVLIVLVVSYFSLGFRSGLVVATAFPLVLGSTFLCMWYLDVDLHRISLGALIISLGLLVDDAIIIIEMMMVKLEQGMGRMKAAGEAFRSTSFPMLTGTLVTIIGFLPMAIAESMMREFLFGLYGVLAIALIVSWLVSVFFTPFVGYYLLPQKQTQADHSDAVYRTPFYNGLRTMVTWSVSHKSVTFLVVGVLIGMTVIAGMQVQKQFFPITDRPELVLTMWLPEGSAFAENERVVDQLDRLLADEPSVVNHVTYLGRDTPRTFIDLNIEQPNDNLSKSIILTSDANARNQLRDKLVRRIAEEIPEARFNIEYFAFGPPIGAAVQYRVKGPDLDVVETILQQVRSVVDEHPDTFGTHLDWRGSVKTVNIKWDKGQLARLGLTQQQLAGQLNSLIHGVPISHYRENTESIPIVTRLLLDERNEIADLNSLPISLPRGGTTPLSQLATVEIGVEDGIRWRHNHSPIMTVRTYVPAEVQPATVVANLQAEIDALRAELPSGYHIEDGGSVETNVIVDAAMTSAMPAVFLLILITLMVQLQSVGRTLLVLLTAPLGVIGAMMTLALFQQPLGFVAQLGITAMAGIIMRNSIILVDQIRHDIEHNAQHPWDALIESTIRRFRPIVLTAAAAIFALIPLTTDRFWGPMAYSMIGGLTVATVLTTFFVPALYSLWYRVKPDSETNAERAP